MKFNNKLATLFIASTCAIPAFSFDLVNYGPKGEVLLFQQTTDGKIKIQECAKERTLIDSSSCDVQKTYEITKGQFSRLIKTFEVGMYESMEIKKVGLEEKLEHARKHNPSNVFLPELDLNTHNELMERYAPSKRVYDDIMRKVSEPNLYSASMGDGGKNISKYLDYVNFGLLVKLMKSVDSNGEEISLTERFGNVGWLRRGNCKLEFESSFREESPTTRQGLPELVESPLGGHHYVRREVYVPGSLYSSASVSYKILHSTHSFLIGQSYGIASENTVNTGGSTTELPSSNNETIARGIQGFLLDNECQPKTKPTFNFDNTDLVENGVSQIDRGEAKDISFGNSSAQRSTASGQ
jgi:hypothetical protein